MSMQQLQPGASSSHQIKTGTETPDSDHKSKSSVKSLGLKSKFSLKSFILVTGVELEPEFKTQVNVGDLCLNSAADRREFSRDKHFPQESKEEVHS